MKNFLRDGEGELNVQVVVALIGAAATLAAALLAGVFGLIQMRAGAAAAPTIMPTIPLPATDESDLFVQIFGAEEAPLGERTYFTIASADAVRIEWTVPGFGRDAIDPFHEADQLFVEPADAGRVGESFTLVVTGYDVNGDDFQATHTFEVTPARAATPPPATPLPAGLRALPVQMPPAGERINLEGEIHGELRLVDGCLRVGEEYAGQQGALIIWPSGFWAAEEKGVIVVYDAESQTVAAVGDFVDMGGGEVWEVFVSPTAQESVTEQPPAECPGPYWIVGAYTARE